MRPVPARIHMERLTKRRRGRDRSFLLTVDRFTLAPGDRIVLSGPHGSGKSTLLELIGLALMPDGSDAFRLEEAAGEDGRRPEVAVDLQALWRRGRHDELARLRARYIGYLPQTGALLPFLTVRENVALVQRLSGRGDRAWLEELRGRLDLAPLWAELPRQLSVGQRQRVAVARALAHRPGLVLADEPTAALDPAGADGVIRLLLALVQEIGCGLLLVSHEAGLAARLGLEELRFASTADQGDLWHSRIARPAPPPATVAAAPAATAATGGAPAC